MLPVGFLCDRSAARLQLRHQPLLEGLAASALANMGAFRSQDLSSTAWSCAVLQLRHEPLLGAIFEASVPKMREAACRLSPPGGGTRVRLGFTDSVSQYEADRAGSRVVGLLVRYPSRNEVPWPSGRDHRAVASGDRSGPTHRPQARECTLGTHSGHTLGVCTPGMHSGRLHAHRHNRIEGERPAALADKYTIGTCTRGMR